MKKIKFALIAVLVFVGILAGCTKKEVAAQPIDEAVDTCEKCHMGVKDNGYAAQYITEDNKSVKFDDIGCMEKYVAEHPDVKIAGKFIQDAQSKDWVKYEDATYVLAADVPTPMGYGVHAFKDNAEAEKFAADNKGTVLTAEQIKTHEWKKVNSNMNMDMHNNSSQNGHEGHNH